MGRHQNTRWIAAVATTATLALAMTACAGGPSDVGSGAPGVTKDEVLVGVSSDMTGPAASNLMPYVNGLRTYFDALNAQGGIQGRKVKLVIEDDKTDTAAGVAVYRKFLTQTPVLAMMGPGSSTIQNAIAAQVRTNDLPVVGPMITSKDSVNPFNPNFFSLACTYADQADVAVPFMMAKTGKTKPRVITALTETASGKEWAALIKERVEAAGGQVLSEHTLAYGALDEDVFAQQVAAEKPDILFMHGATGTGQVMMKSLAKFGVTNLPIGATSVLQDALIPLAGPNVSDDYYSFDCYKSPKDGGAAGAAVIENAKKAGFAEKDYNRPQFTQGYVAAQLLAKGIDASGVSPTRESVGKELEKLANFDTGGLSPLISFGPQNRVGVHGMLAFHYDKAKGEFTPEGKFDDYAKCITNYYVTKSIASWSPSCLK